MQFQMNFIEFHMRYINVFLKNIIILSIFKTRRSPDIRLLIVGRNE